jgi:hypothetical protein
VPVTRSCGCRRQQLVEFVKCVSFVHRQNVDIDAAVVQCRIKESRRAVVGICAAV